MAIYNKPARQTVIDLINEANPDLPFAINTVDYDLTNPVTITTLPNGHNTEIRLIPKPNAPYVGNLVLTYRRLNLAYLFRNIIPTIRQWVPNGGNSNSTTTRASFFEFIPLFVKKYGVLLEESQLSNVTLQERDGLDPNRYFSITARNDSLVWVGSTQAKWILGERRLSELLQVDEIEGRLYPSYDNTPIVYEEETGNVVENTYRPLLTPLTHHIDFTMYAQENSTYWDRTETPHNFLTRYDTRWSTWVDVYQHGYYRAILNDLFLQELGFGVNQVGTNQPNENSYVQPMRDGVVTLGNIPMEIISLPHADYPEANSEFFNSAVVIKVPDNCPWGVGNMFLHYNR